MLSVVYATAAILLGQVVHVSERTFDVLLRDYPVALVAFVAPWCGVHCKMLLPELESLTSSFADTGIAVAQASSDEAGELLDRFEVAAYPTLLWFDGSRKWPFYASEAKPERYHGERSHDRLIAFIEERTGIAPPQRATPPAAPTLTRTAARQHDDKQTPPPEAKPHASERFQAHACKSLSQSYIECMRHRRDRQHLCASERHEYLLCMSGRWSVHPDDHQHLAARYADYVRTEENH